MVDCDLEQVAIFTLEEEKEGTLRFASSQDWSTKFYKRRTFILCMTAAIIITPREGSSKGCARRGMGTRC